MAGIYIHYPYCKQKCHYCNFFSVATKKFKGQFTEALLKELALRKHELQSSITSIYFGGGTPSMLTVEEIRKITEHISILFQLQENAEITLEANPDDLNYSYLGQLKNTMINRLSIGIQSFNDNELKSINRVHDANAAYNSVKMAQDAGFDNLSIDLIYGIPNSTYQSWLHNLEMVHELRVAHLSAYTLTQESRTAYDILVKKGKLLPPDDEKALEQYAVLQNHLSILEMEQYEISNYSRRGMRANHNTNYWKGIPYLGLGPSAHSFDGNSRRWNKAALTDYIGILDGLPLEYEKEILTPENKWNERMMTGLRTQWGIDVENLARDFPENWVRDFEQLAHDFIEKGLMVQTQSVFCLSPKGKLFADGIASDFFRDEQKGDYKY